MCETLGRTIERNQNQNECLRHERGAKKENSKVLSNKLKWVIEYPPGAVFSAISRLYIQNPE